MREKLKDPVMAVALFSEFRATEAAEPSTVRTLRPWAARSCALARSCTGIPGPRAGQEKVKLLGNKVSLEVRLAMYPELFACLVVLYKVLAFLFAINHVLVQTSQRQLLFLNHEGATLRK